MNDFWKAVAQLDAAVARNRAVNVNSDHVRQLARGVAQLWFRSARPEVIDVGVPESELQDLDSCLQGLLRLANGRNPKRSYQRALRSVRGFRPELEARVDMRTGHAQRRDFVAPTSQLETGVIRTLEQMLPHAALSYRQVLADLAGPPRYSYRGTATELREVVREVLDHLAPDIEVVKAPAFKLEKERRGPTMKQKARFILRARGVGESSRSAPEQSVELLEDQIASLARSVYERGSASTHAVTLKAQVLSFKAYADAVLAELLQLHVTT